MRPCYAYIRISTTKQGEGVSLQEQRDAIERFAERNSLHVIEWFEEQETAAKRGRPVFARLLKQLRKRRITAVVIHKIDRSTRNLKDWADLGELIDGGIDVHFANETLDMRTRGGRLAADIQAVVAADYIRNLREEARKGFIGRCKQGLYALPAPNGYLDQGGGKAKIPDPDKKHLVRKTFHLYATGRYNLFTLTEEVRRMGLTNKNGRPMSRNAVWGMLKTPFHIGLIRIVRTGEIFPGGHEPIVETSVFNRVQSILNGKAVVVSARHTFLYRRFLICLHCHYSLNGELQKGHVYYRCHTLSCPTRSIREELVTEQIQKQLAPIQFNEEDLLYLRELVTAKRTKQVTEHDAQVKSLEFSKKAIDDRLGRLTDLLVDQQIDQETFNRKRTTWLLEKARIEENLGIIRAHTGILFKRIDEFLELIQTAYLSHEMATPAESVDVLKKLTSNCVVDQKNVSVRLKSPYSVVAEYRQLSYGGPSKDRPRTLDELLSKLIDVFANNPDVSTDDQTRAP